VEQSVIVVLTPDVKEARGLLGAFRRSGFVAQDATLGVLPCSVLPDLDMLVAVGGNGKAQFAAQTQYVLDRCPETKVLICAGAAGRLDTAISIGDIVVGTGTVEHDYRTRMSPRPPPCHDPDPNILEQFVSIAARSAFPFRVHFGLIASGDEDIVDSARAQELRALTHAMCVAWEGSGGARAARLSRVPFIEIRCITDGADSTAHAAFQANVGSVMSNVAQLLAAWGGTGEASVSGTVT
jgi:adenosylhomocysteine nucleosidase